MSPAVSGILQYARGKDAWEVYQMLFVHGINLVIDSREKLKRVVRVSVGV